MPRSRHWSKGSAPCRLELAPSRALAVSFALLGAAGAFSVLVSEVARVIAVPLAVGAVTYGWWLCRRELRQPVRMLVVPLGGGPATLDGRALDSFQVEWRWPLAILQGRTGDGRAWRAVLTPERLDLASRRELRLAIQARHSGGSRRSMAP